MASENRNQDHRRAGNHFASDNATRDGKTVVSPVPVSLEGVSARQVRGASDARAAGGDGGTRAHSSRKAKKRSGGRAAAVALGSLAGVAVIIYAGGVFAFSNVLYPNTHIADEDVSLMTRDQAIDRVQAAADSYSLTVEGDGFSWKWEPEGSASVLDAKGAVERVMDTNQPFEWPVRLYRALTAGAQVDSGSAAVTTDSADVEAAIAELPSSFDKDAFTDQLGQAVDQFNQGRAGTFDAAGAFDEASGTFTLEKVKSNRKLSKESIANAALAAVATLTGKVELDDSSFEPSAGGATDEQLQTAIDTANRLIGANVNLTMGGATVATLDGSQLMQWVTFDSDLKPTLATDQVSTWVANLAKKIDTVGTQRTYTRPDGKQVTVSGGVYGWVSDEAALIAKLQEAVKNAQTGDIEVPTKQTADKFTDAGQPDWGAYVDVDLGEQHARYYDASGNLIWEATFISGNPNKGNATPQGVYKLNNKARDQTLIGLDKNGDGEPDYKTPISYWMPFEGNLVGFHDASWQSAANLANPSAYLRVGSHGCINLAPAKAAELYEKIQTGTCVVVHG